MSDPALHPMAQLRHLGVRFSIQDDCLSVDASREVIAPVQIDSSPQDGQPGDADSTIAQFVEPVGRIGPGHARNRSGVTPCATLPSGARLALSEPRSSCLRTDARSELTKTPCFYWLRVVTAVVIYSPARTGSPWRCQ